MTAFRRYETQKLYPSPAMDTDTSAPIIYVLIHAGKYYFFGDTDDNHLSRDVGQAYRRYNAGSGEGIAAF